MRYVYLEKSETQDKKEGEGARLVITPAKKEVFCILSRRWERSGFNIPRRALSDKKGSTLTPGGLECVNEVSGRFVPHVQHPLS